MKKAIYISLALAIFVLASAKSSYACSCIASPAPVKEQIRGAFSYADAVFSGEVVEIKESPAEKDTLLVKFKVAKSWKGNDQPELTIKTARDSAMCGYNFMVGQKYLVYASGAGDALSTNNCSRTTTLGSKDDTKYLDKLKRKKKSSA
jgi:hypothetical protein